MNEDFASAVKGATILTAFVAISAVIGVTYNFIETMLGADNATGLLFASLLTIPPASIWLGRAVETRIEATTSISSEMAYSSSEKDPTPRAEDLSLSELAKEDPDIAETILKQKEAELEELKKKLPPKKKKRGRKAKNEKS